MIFKIFDIIFLWDVLMGLFNGIEGIFWRWDCNGIFDGYV